MSNLSVKQICVESRTSALNMTLPAAAARAPAAVDRYLLPTPSRRVRQAADVDQRDKQTDRQTDTLR